MSQTPIENLRRIMAALRDKDTGCPWDVEQTHQSIAHYAVEEAYELADAIERNDINEMQSELGDMLLQVVFHAQMAQEAGHFNFDNVAQSISDKMILRHPHVFGNDEQRNAAQQSAAWEEQKAKERADAGNASQMDNIPVTLPPLTRAEKIQKRAARVGFDWDDTKDVIAKIHEELQEVEDAKTQEELKAEIGDLLFAVINLARHHHIRADEALQLTNKKFETRFRHMEASAQAENTFLKEETIAELEARWQKAKSI